MGLGYTLILMPSHLSEILHSMIFTIVESECDKHCNKHDKRYLTIPIVHLPGEAAKGKKPFVSAFPFAFGGVKRLAA